MKKNVLFLVYTLTVMLVTLYFSLQIIDKGKTGGFVYVDTKSHDEPKYERLNPWYINCSHKPDNSFRIIVIGDSFTQGYLLNYWETYPYFLEGKLNSKSKEGNFEVLNFGNGGLGMIDKFELFEKKALSCKPDLVVVQYLWDDFRNRSRIVEIANNLYGFNRSSENFTEYALEFEVEATKMYTEELFSSYSFEKIWEENVRIPLQKFIYVAEESDIDLLLIFIPDCDVYRGHETGLNFLKNFVEDNNIIFLELTQTFKNYDSSELCVIPNDNHPSAFAHRITADEIYEKIIKEKLIDTS